MDWLRPCPHPGALGTTLELLAYVLKLTPGQPDASAHKQAGELLASPGGLGGLPRLSLQELQARAAIDSEQARNLEIALELGRRSVLDEVDARFRRCNLSSPEDVMAWARPRLLSLEHEEVWLLSLTGGGALLQADRIASGAEDGCSLHPKELLRPAVRNGASAVILVHNHPSGNPTPSLQDQSMTRVASELFELFSIPLLDHVVVATEGYRSVLD